MPKGRWKCVASIDGCTVKAPCVQCFLNRADRTLKDILEYCEHWAGTYPVAAAVVNKVRLYHAWRKKKMGKNE